VTAVPATRDLDATAEIGTKTVSDVDVMVNHNRHAAAKARINRDAMAISHDVARAIPIAMTSKVVHGRIVRQDQIAHQLLQLTRRHR